ncbi:MAG: type II toxin-antitoxin system PrlF family antitoxin, partial [Pseudomonadota bacterium]
MTALAQEVSKLTDRYQTTVPAGVRKQLKLGKGRPCGHAIAAHSSS